MHELNLLPPHRRRSLRHQASLIYLQHFLDSLLWGAGMLAVAGVAIWVVLWFAATTASSGSAEELIRSIENYQVLRDEIAEQNLFLTNIHTIGKTRIVWSAWLFDFLESVPPGVDIQQFTGTVGAATEEGRIITAAVTGSATTSRTLDAFTRELRALPRVVNVEAPLSNLLKPEAYTLTITFEDNGETK